MSIQQLTMKFKSNQSYSQIEPYPTQRTFPLQPVNRKLCGLEQNYQDICFRNIVREECSFPNYIEPNEKFPTEAADHCRSIEEGIAVVTGSERSFFLLCLLDSKICRGLVSRDINPNIKAYIDFNVLLLRISSTKEEYMQLSDRPTDYKSYEDRIKCIAEKIESGRLPDTVKRYYQTNLFNYGNVYLNSKKLWRNKSSFDGCNYYKCDFLFKKVKSYADTGDIIAVTGSINDLMFLKGKNVSIIDTSNIFQYCFLNLKVEGHPRVIWTCRVNEQWQYNSYTHIPLSDEETLEFEQIIDIIKSCNLIEKKSVYSDPYAFYLLEITRGLKKSSEANLGPVFSKKTLKFLRKYRTDNTLAVPGLGHINLCSDGILKLNQLSSSQISELCSETRTRAFVYNLVKQWDLLKPSVYLAFNRLEGWNDILEDYFTSAGSEFDEFLDRFQRVGLYHQFIQELGSERFVRLMNRIDYCTSPWMHGKLNCQ